MVTVTRKRRADSKLRWSEQQWADWAIENGISLDQLLDYKLRHLKGITSRMLRRNAGGLVDEARNRPCTDCGIRLHRIMEFDHVRGHKEFSINVAASKSADLLVAEIAKCDIRCPNCHRMRHYWLSHMDDPYFIDNPPPPLWITYL